ncbi:MAG: zinc ribbon domain-containing protein [Actinomycetota bacterium]|nr:zinc ribbon domain-containing protein [Actinomycetota bacterium]
MPRYEYECKSCKKRFEVVHGINETVDSCEYCGGNVRKVFHPVGVIFKGSGFYSTDSKGSGSSTVAPSAKTTATQEKTKTNDGEKPGDNGGKTHGNQSEDSA